MTNLAESFEAAAEGQILFAVIGKDGRKGRSEHLVSGKVLPWSEARSYLDYDYDSGFGGTDCHAVYAWTETRVLFAHEYDGATSVNWVPRNPEPCEPDFGGSSDF